MVFFICDQCGQCLKKNQVEKHCSFKCRNSASLSCMDCNKVFWGDDYKGHTQCITENEKYGGKDYKPKPNSNKNALKQEKWIEGIKEIISAKKITGQLSRVLSQLIDYENIPRKQKKFENFLKSSLKVNDPKLMAEAWEVFAQSTKKDFEASNNQTSSTNESPSTDGSQLSNGNSHNSSGKRSLEMENGNAAKKPKQELSESNSDTNGDSNGNSDEFDWCKESEQILQNYPSGLSEKKLRKLVIAEYKSKMSEASYTKDELKTLFRNELFNNRNLNVHISSKNVNEC